MNSRFFTSTNKTTVSLLFIGLIGLLSPKAVAQEAVPITEENIPRREDVTVLRGIIDALEGIEPISYPETPFVLGGSSSLEDDPENYSTYQIQVDPDLKFDVNSRSQDWFNLNTGDGSRGSATTPIFRF